VSTDVTPHTPRSGYRSTYDVAFKAQVAAEAIAGKRTTALAMEHDVPPSCINRWARAVEQALTKRT
jgi:transposase-like protein